MLQRSEGSLGQPLSESQGPQSSSQSGAELCHRLVILKADPSLGDPTQHPQPCGKPERKRIPGVGHLRLLSFGVICYVSVDR
jgi:hypothetical protein